jgi:HD-like signal output (HDOD) protein/CheY-like chemotaxis protein
VLFVDDDQHVLDGLSASLRRMRHKWNMEFICGGAAAIARLDAGKVDAVVTDMRMPGVDGEAVLLAARERWPSSLRIILSGQTERVVVQRTIGIAHQFLSKPCGVDELRDCLQKLLDSTMVLDEPTRVVVCAANQLPFSSVAVAQLKGLCSEPSMDMARIVACIEQDAGLAAKLLHVAGAGFFAARQSVASVAAALTVLGVETTLAVLRQAEPHKLDRCAVRLARHTQATGQLLVRWLGGDDARLCGALHGLGKLVLLARFGDAYAELLDRVEQSPDLRLYELELERFGMSHDVVGAHVAALWGIPPSLVEAIRVYTDPSLAARGTTLSAALHVACAVTRGCTTFGPELLAQSGLEGPLAADVQARKETP